MKITELLKRAEAISLPLSVLSMATFGNKRRLYQYRSGVRNPKIETLYRINEELKRYERGANLTGGKYEGVMKEAR